jgi:hypothetical protein
MLGIPLSTPGDESVVPVGRIPVDNEKLIGLCPELSSTVVRYNWLQEQHQVTKKKAM